MGAGETAAGGNLMKKFLCFILACIILMSLMACSKKVDTNPPIQETKQPTTQPTEQKKEEAYLKENLPLLRQRFNDNNTFNFIFYFLIFLLNLVHIFLL